MVTIVLLKRMIRRESTPEIPFTDETLEWTSCHYADDVYPFDLDCGAQLCFLNMSGKPHIGVHNAWDDELRTLRHDLIYDMMAYMNSNYNELPDTIEYLRFKGREMQVW
eukprot:CAMPEP_0114672568 /NCGR_PEP_ID=MMETSP0191-20121206/43160_1 /TAXON_ID=126664 /ORGANISM="Sorites sp." /LENGTH=108 /DNA_ID=CAMNT_0001935285 /DNA_START=183 /DNA_END=506 /DNA_ORIENTATION=-